MKFYQTEKLGIVEIYDGYVRSPLVRTCPKCGKYMRTIMVDAYIAELVGLLGRWRCESCGYILGLDIYDMTDVNATKKTIEKVEWG